MKRVAFVILLAGIVVGTPGCLSPHGGPVLLYPIHSALEPRKGVRGSHGTSHETALQVYGYRKELLEMAEDQWVYKHHWPETPRTGLNAYPHMDQEFHDRLERRTERVGKRVYDILRLTLPSGEIRTFYFDVTNYRYWYPKGE